MDDTKERFSWFATLLGFIIDSREAIIWLVPVVGGLISNVTLLQQPEPPLLPGSKFRFGAEYQFALLLSTIFVYFHFLRKRWISDQLTEDPLSESFARFIFRDLPVFKRPLLLIPPLFFLVLWLNISVSALNSESDQIWGILGLSVLFIIIVVMSALFSVITDTSSNMRMWEYREEWNSDEILVERWLERVRRKLVLTSSLTTLDFAENVGLNLLDKLDNEEVNWAIEKYFHLHELEENLTLSRKYTEYRDGKPISCYTLSKDGP